MTGESTELFAREARDHFSELTSRLMKNGISLGLSEDETYAGVLAAAIVHSVSIADVRAIRNGEPFPAKHFLTLVKDHVELVMQSGRRAHS